MSLNFYNKLVLIFLSLIFLVKTYLVFQIRSFEKITKFKKNFLLNKNFSKDHISKGCFYIEKIAVLLRIKKCLVKTIAKRNLVNFFGYRSDLYIGVSFKEDGLQSHSWLVSDGINCSENSISDMKIIKIIKG